jgi:hypothetical protein
MEPRRDVVRWGPVFAGTVAALSSLVLLSLLGAAIGLGNMAATPAGDAGMGAAIWGGIATIIAFFVGGWVAASGSAVGGRFSGMLNGALVWGFTVLLAFFMAAIGLGSLVAAINPPATAQPGAISTAQSVVWATFIGLVLGLAAALIGGSVGSHPEPSERR